MLPSFPEALDARRVLVADGATGTNYQAMGLEHGQAPEEWVFERPDRVAELHREFVDAGADIVLTCSFGATAIRLQDTPLAGRARTLNLRAAELARTAVEGRALVAGSLGPTGQLFEPLGPLRSEAAVEAYAEQAEALTDGGVDLLVLETFFALEEAVAAVEGARAGSRLPLVVAFSFDQGTRTMMGLRPVDAVEELAGRGVAALGANCGRSLADTDAGRRGVPRSRRRRAGLGQAERRNTANRRRRGGLRRGSGNARRARPWVRGARRPDRRWLLRLDSRARTGNRRGRCPAASRVAHKHLLLRRIDLYRVMVGGE